jgi:hypothetical protein
MKNRNLIAIIAAACVASFASGIRAQVPPDMAGAIHDTQTKQEQIQSEAQGVVASVDSIIAEYKRHGMENRDDVKTLNAIRKVLSTMSAQEMQQVIALLQQARNAGSADVALHQSAQASATQGTIVDQLKKLLAIHNRQQHQYDLADRFSALAKRQDTNLTDLLDANRAKLTGNSPDVLRDALNLQKQSQDQLAGDVQTALTDLDAMLAADQSAGSDRVQKAIDESRSDHLADNVAMASTELGANHIYQAATAEKSSRDALRDLARILTLPTDTLSKLRQAIRDVDQAITDQKAVNNDTQQAMNQHQPRDQRAELEKKQAAAVDETDQVRKALDAVSPRAVDDLKQAIDKMQDARAELKNQPRQETAAEQQAALAKLQQAKQDLQNQADQLAAKQENQADNLTKAQALKAQIEALKEKQSTLQTQTQAGLDRQELKDAKDMQADYHQAALDIQQQALETAPAAVTPLQTAAKDMDTAQRDLGQPQADQKDAADQQGQAVAALDQAAAAMDQQIAKLQQEQKDADALAKAQADLARIMQQQQKVQEKTDNAAAKKQDADAQPLAADQKQIAQDTNKVADALPQAAADAAKPLADAQQAMKQSAADLNKPNATDAAAQQQQAMNDLNQAQQQLAQQAAQLNQDLGKPQDNAPAQTDAAQKLDNAIKETADANQQMQDNPPPANQPDAKAPTAADLQKQQQQIAQALQQMPQNPTVAQAQQAAQQAAQDLAQNQPQQAVADMHQAEQAMQEAAQPADPNAQQPKAPQANDQKPADQPQQGEQANKPEQANAEHAQGEPGQKPEQANAEQGQHQGEHAEAGQHPEQGEHAEAGQHQGQGEHAEAGQHQGQGEHAEAGQHQGQGEHAGQGQGQPQMGQLIQQQQKLEQEAAQLAQQTPAQQLADAAQQLAQAAAQDPGGLPPDAAQAMQQAQANLQQAEAQAQAGNTPAAEQAAQAAQAEMGQAKTAMAMAQGGPPEQGPPGEEPGQEPGKPGNKPGQADENKAIGGSGNRKDIGKGTADGGPRKEVSSAGQYLGLPPRDRAALQQSRAEKYPQEYAGQVEQYLQNLSDDSAKK